MSFLNKYCEDHIYGEVTQIYQKLKNINNFWKK